MRIAGATGSGYRPGPRYLLIPGSGFSVTLRHLLSLVVIDNQAQRFRAFGSPWWASGGRPPRVPDPARAAISGPRFGGFFFGVQPSIFGPIGRAVERSPGGPLFAGPDLPETLPGNEGEAAVNVRLYRRFLDLRKCSFSEARFCAGESISENRAGGEAEE